MILKFKTMTVQNVLSFGNTPTTIDFTKGLNLITGPNGAGKSSMLLDALSVALFDKPYRAINKNDVINRKNKKDLKVDVEFSVNDTEYRIVRGLKNKEVELDFYIDNVLQEEASTKALGQSEIERHIGIDYKLFKQIISLSINHNKPFLTLPAGEKRELLEKFVNIDVIAVMNKHAKETNKQLKIKRDMNANSISHLKATLENDKKHILEFQASKKTFDDDIQSEIDEIDVEIDEHKESLVTIKADANIKKNELKDIVLIENAPKLREDKDANTKLKNDADYEIRTAKKILKDLEDGDICPTCGTDLSDKSEEHKADEIKKQEDIISKSEKVVKKQSKAIDGLKEQLDDFDKNVTESNNIKFSIKSLKTKYISTEEKIIKLEGSKEKISKKEFSVDIPKLKKEYKVKHDDYKAHTEEYNEQVKAIELQEQIIVILSDKGVKSYIFSQLIPVLNSSVNYYLNMFDLPIVIEFDESMNDSIKTTSNFNKDVGYMSFSEGEKKKIDIAILLSFISVTKKIANWNCNLLVIDELLDSSIDEAGLEKLLESLEKMSKDDEDLGVYIISHRFKLEYKHFFNKMIEIKKNVEGFSKINYL